MYHIKQETSKNIPSFMSYLSSIPSVPSTSTTISSSDIADSKDNITTINDDYETCKECKRTFKCPIEFKIRVDRSYDHHEWICFICCQTCQAYQFRGARDFPCSLCEKRCFDSIGLRQHFEAKHPGKKFPSILLRTPVTKEIPCDHCSSVFFERKFQRRHMREKHVELSLSHACQDCRRRFYTERGLMSHRSHHCLKLQTNATLQAAPKSIHPMITRSKLRYQMYNKHPTIMRSKRKYRALLELMKPRIKRKVGSSIKRRDDVGSGVKHEAASIIKLEDKMIKSEKMEVNSDNLRIKREVGDSIKREDDVGSGVKHEAASIIKLEDKMIKSEEMEVNSNNLRIKREVGDSIKREDDVSSGFKREYASIKLEDIYMPKIKHER